MVKMFILGGSKKEKSVELLFSFNICYSKFIVIITNNVSLRQTKLIELDCKLNHIFPDII